jgi:hypothetical protein
MVKADEIRDEESLRGWLEGRPREDSVIVAMRAAARAAPVAWAHPILREREGELTSVSICRSLLIASVAARGPNPAIIAAAWDSAGFTDDVLSGASEIRMSVAAAARAAWAVGDDPATFAVDAVTQVARLDSGWSEVSHDCGLLNGGEDLSGRALWSVRYPVYFRDAWAQFLELWQTDRNYRFWLRWWEGVVSGNPFSWDLQEKVALIPNEVWQEGPGAVAEAIHEIEEVLRGQKSSALEAAINDKPYALRIRVDAASTTLIADELREFELTEIIEAIKASMADFARRTKAMMSGNQPGQALRETAAPAIREIRRDLTRYAGSPLKLHDAISDAVAEVMAAARREGVVSEPVLQRMVANWVRQQTDLCGACPELLDTIQRRTMVMVAQFTEVETRQALALGRRLQDVSSGYLRVASAWALKIVQDPSSSKEHKQSAWYFLAAVLPRGAQAAIDFEEQRAKPKEAGGLVKTAKDMADLAVAGDKIVDVAQENASEIADFGHWVASEIMSGNWFGFGSGFGG